MIRDSLILKGFHPDPSVIRVGSTFYVASSTFEWFPGVVIHESEDLINWKFTTYVLDSEEALPLRGVLNGGGVWAPCLSYDGEYYYLVFSITRTFDEFTQDTDNYITRAADIHGPWSEPVYLNSGGFDASLFHDQNGQKYLLNMIWYEYPGENHFHGIEMQELDGKTLKLKGDRKIIYKGTERGFTEGPHIYRHGDYYYLLTAEGGTSEAHCVTIARSTNLWGPYETYGPGPILTAHNHPELNIHYAGHGDIVDDEFGNWYLFHLGARRKLFGGFSVFGRETFMQNIIWDDEGWPRLLEGNLPKDTVIVPDELAKRGEGRTDVANVFYKRYDFAKGRLSSDFMSRREPLKDRLSLDKRPGYLRLYGGKSLSAEFDESLLAVRIMECSFRAETVLDYNPCDVRQRAGLIFLYHSANYYYLSICYDDDKSRRYLQLFKRDCKKTTAMLKDRIYLPDEGEVKLWGDFTPSGITFGYGIGNEADTELDIPRGECPVTILSDEYANISIEQGFTGSFTGICAQDTSGMLKAADFAYFEIKEHK